MTNHLTLRDIDNRDADGAPYEFTGTPTKLISYLNGPVRSDLSTPAAAGRLDAAIAALRAGDIDEANKQLGTLSIHIGAATMTAPEHTNGDGR